MTDSQLLGVLLQLFGLRLESLGQHSLLLSKLPRMFALRFLEQLLLLPAQRLNLISELEHPLLSAEGLRCFRGHSRFLLKF